MAGKTSSHYLQMIFFVKGMLSSEKVTISVPATYGNHFPSYLHKRYNNLI